jgi:sugar phosphate isomerase/epimerase
MKIGLQTYTVKKSISTPEGFDRTMAEVSAAGLKYIELAADYLGFPFNVKNARMMRDVLDKYGIRTVSCQIRQKRMEQDFPVCLEAFQILGTTCVTNSVIDVTCLRSAASVIQYAEQLEKYRQKLEANHLELAHHNHHFECLRFENKTVLDILAEHYHGGFVPDTYWLARGGIDPVGLILKLGERIKIMHIKDFRLKATLFGLKPVNAPIGEGNIDFEYILFKASRYGVAYAMIEQGGKDELANVKISAANAFAIKGTV